MPTYNHYLILYTGEPVIIDRIEGHTLKIEVIGNEVTVFYHAGTNAYLYKKYKTEFDTVWIDCSLDI